MAFGLWIPAAAVAADLAVAHADAVSSMGVLAASGLVEVRPMHSPTAPPGVSTLAAGFVPAMRSSPARAWGHR